MEQAGVVLDEQEAAAKGTAKRKSKKTMPAEEASIETMSVENLEKLLTKVLSQEDYEKAAKIRDEINNRKGIDSGQS